MIYKLKHDYQNTYSLLIDGGELFSKMPSFRPRFLGQSKLQEWVMPNASFYYSANFEGMRETLPDMATWSAGVVLLSPRAYAVFADLLKKSGEFLPISIEGEIYYLFNTLYIIPESGIDRDKAVEVINSGVHFGQINVLFDEAFLAGENIIIFKTPTDKFLYSFCTDQFREIYQQHDFQGLVFEEVLPVL